MHKKGSKTKVYVNDAPATPWTITIILKWISIHYSFMMQRSKGFSLFIITLVFLHITDFYCNKTTTSFQIPFDFIQLQNNKPLVLSKTKRKRSEMSTVYLMTFHSMTCKLWHAHCCSIDPVVTDYSLFKNKHWQTQQAGYIQGSYQTKSRKIVRTQNCQRGLAISVTMTDCKK